MPVVRVMVQLAMESMTSREKLELGNRVRPDMVVVRSGELTLILGIFSAWTKLLKRKSRVLHCYPLNVCALDWV